MLKSELTAKLAEQLNHIPEQTVHNNVSHLIDIMRWHLGNGRRIEIRGFGNFSLRYQPPRKAHNPSTQESFMTLPRYNLHFKAGKTMRERINRFWQTAED